MIDVNVLRFMADMSAGASLGGPDLGYVMMMRARAPKILFPPKSKNFDLAKYEAERDAVSMAIVSRNMERARYGRKQTVESVSNGAWCPQRGFLNNGRDPHASWRRKR